MKAGSAGFQHAALQAACQHFSTPASQACQHFSKSSRSFATRVEPVRRLGSASCAAGRGQNRKTDLLTSEGLQGPKRAEMLTSGGEAGAC
jgi:hypothetical protein